MNVAIIGTGYVGLVSGTCFAETGNNVICVDIDEEKVRKLTAGEVIIFEPGLDEVLARNVNAGLISFTTNLKEAVEFADVIFLALPTPPDEDGSADLSYILNSANEIGGLINNYKVIVDKSTVPVGTSKLVRHELLKKSKFPVSVVSNPEFLREGSAVNDFLFPERVIIGTNDDKAAAMMVELYKPFIKNDSQLLLMDEKSAELTKYAANAFLATKITFMNEIANLCDRVGANVESVKLGIGSDSRIGSKFLNPGIGFGGSCFPKDIQALVKKAEENSYNFRILNSVIEVNEHQKVVLVTKLKRYFESKLEGLRIGIWGLSFKPNTDDIRMASSLKIIDPLVTKGAFVKVYDPVAMNNAKHILGDKVAYMQTAQEAATDVDALIIATEWEEFCNFDIKLLSQIMKNNVVFDGRNIFDPKEMGKLGFHYESIGRPLIK
ncbi:MAG: UDP-glucose/GDP-mannose dehydrogenase family protein [Chitinophagales bacterium]